jgi:hypothetical protein
MRGWMRKGVFIRTGRVRKKDWSDGVLESWLDNLSIFVFIITPILHYSKYITL